MKKKRILVVLGGKSKERNVSLSSGNACYEAIKRLGYKVEKFDTANKYIDEIDKSKTDIIFNALHGKDGEDGVAQSYFEYLKIPYTHSGVISSINAMDKNLSKEIFKKNKILSPNYIMVKKEDYKDSQILHLIKKNRFNFPIVIKPTNEGSSIGVKICKNIKILKKEIKKLFKNYNNLILETYISGQEVQVAVMNGKALGAIELKPKRDFYDYKAKYLKSAKTIHLMPANISKNNYKKILAIAEKVHKLFKCRGVTRSDFKFFKNKFYLFEINTQPGMTNLSLVPEIAKFKGIAFDKLVHEILLDASINK
jgi:D-alanine-D-alanine ligase